MVLTVSSTGINFNNGSDLTAQTTSTVILNNACLIIKNYMNINSSNQSSYVNTASYGTEYTYLNKNTSSSIGHFPSLPDFTYSLITYYRILCAEELNIYSDKRIKKNIHEISKEFAYHTLRNLVPISYQYKDVVKRGGGAELWIYCTRGRPHPSFCSEKNQRLYPQYL